MMYLSVPLVMFASVAELATAEYLHLMQRRVGLTEGKGEAGQLPKVTECEGFDCDLSKSTRNTTAANRHAMRLNQESVGNVDCDAFFSDHKAFVEERLNPPESGNKKPKPGNDVEPVDVYPAGGEDFVQWSICNATFHSNLGGNGPDDGEKGLRYFNAAHVVDSEGHPRALDLFIRALGGYRAEDLTANGLYGGTSCFGQINVRAKPGETKSITLQLRWYLAGTTTPAVLSKQYLTLYNEDGNPNSCEAVTIYNKARGVYTTSNTALHQSDELGSGPTFSAARLFDNVVMPSDPKRMSEQQANRAVTMHFFQKSQIKLTFSVTGETRGRNFAFSGNSVLTSAHGFTPAHDACTQEGTCSIYEDPHIKVFDGVQISLLSTKRRVLADYGSGDMWLVKSADISIQGRYLPDPDIPEKNLFVRAVAVGGPFLNGGTLILGPIDGEITWNGEPILDLQTSAYYVDLGKGSLFARRHMGSHLVQDMTQTNAGVDIDLPGGVKITLNRFKKHVNIFIQMPPAAGGQDGLCGNFNCRSGDDALDMILKYRNPKVPPGDSLFEQ